MEARAHGHDATDRVPAGGGRAPAAAFLASVAQAAKPSDHPYGGMAFLRLGEPVCFATLAPKGRSEIEISGMYSPSRRGGRHAMGYLALLADLHGVTLSLVAASILPSRMDTQGVADWYRCFGFEGRAADGTGRVPMKRPPRAVLFMGPSGG